MGEGKTFYLTKKGLEKIKKEYKALETIRLAKTKGESPKILESEDLNPEYLSFREDLSLLESKIAERENVLKNARLIKVPPRGKQNIVDLGATVAVEIDGEDKDEFTIVGTLEASPVLGKISNESPVGAALMGHKVGEEIIVSSPIKTNYKIKKIKYDQV